MPRLAILLLLLLGLPPAPLRATASGESEGGLEGLFAAAEQDRAQVVPLILAGSRAISTSSADEGHALATRLEPFCRRAFFGPERLPAMERLGLGLHSVAAGELPARIAKRYRLGTGLFSYLNEDYDERRLQAGQGLKVLDLSREGALMLIVDRERHRLAAWRAPPQGEADEWVLLAYVPVGLGAPETPTPSGTTRITLRVRNPEWTDPVSGRVFAPDDPGNLLGGYWMALAAEGLGGRQGIGLHGYTGSAPEDWLGKNLSNGCVRMLQPDIDRVFHLALEGTPVTIAP